MQSILVLNGPNLNRLGVREVSIYGDTNYVQLTELLHSWAQELELAVEVRQSNSESELVEWIHGAIDEHQHVVLNPAAFTHYSYALRDACAMMAPAGLKLLEVHLSNPAAREEFRHNSVISGVATGTIAGFGIDSYRLALQYLASM